MHTGKNQVGRWRFCPLRLLNSEFCNRQATTASQLPQLFSSLLLTSQAPQQAPCSSQAPALQLLSPMRELGYSSLNGQATSTAGTVPGRIGQHQSRRDTDPGQKHHGGRFGRVIRGRYRWTLRCFFMPVLWLCAVSRRSSFCVGSCLDINA
jgi:hypothetical protein